MSYDLVVIGTGPGGYVCAIRAAQLGLKIAVVEKDKTFGGTCLNVGCIPSKALLHASELFDEAGHSFAKMGIKVGTPKLDLAAMMKFKDEGVDGNVKGVAFLFKKNKIDAFHGAGRIAAPGKVEVKRPTARPRRSRPRPSSSPPARTSRASRASTIDEKRIVSSTGALALDEGAGEAAGGRRRRDRARARLGVAAARRQGARWSSSSTASCPAWTSRSRKQFQRILRSRASRSSWRPRSPAIDTSGRDAQGERRAGGGRRGRDRSRPTWCWSRSAACPTPTGSASTTVGVKLDNRGRVVVDAHFATNVPGIYAIGDVIAGPMLAHKAEDEGVAVAEIIAGQAGHVNYDVIPNVVYTFPEVASVGKTEEELKAAGVAYKVGKFPFTANGRAKVNQQTDGFVKILADAKTDRVLGVHIIGAGRRQHDRRGRRRDGVRRLGRGHRPHLPRPPDADRGGQGSRAWRWRSARSTCKVGE